MPELGPSLGRLTDPAQPAAGALGAMVLAHRERFERRKSQRELAQERFMPGGHPTTLPNPGVYARNNAVDIAARLPDGSASELSVSAILQKRTVGQTTGRDGDS